MSSSYTYEEKMHLLKNCKPEMKDILLARLIKGERVDITKDSDLFFQINADRMSMDDFMKQDRFKHAAEATKQDKAAMADPKYGRTKQGRMRWLGDIPLTIWLTHPWFSPNLSREERNKNAKKWLNMYPVFRAGEKAV